MPRRTAPAATTLSQNYGLLSQNLGQLSPRRQEIIRPVLENPREYVLLNVRALAQRLETNPATIVRIVRALSFPSYKTFQQYLHDLSGIQFTSLDSLTAGRKAAGSVTGLLQSSLTQDQRNLSSFVNALNPQTILDLAKRIYDAEKILLLGGDFAASLISMTEYQLSVVGIPVFTATTTGRTAHVVRIFSERDVVIAMSFGRGLRQTVEGLQNARKIGAYCVGITDTFLSPIARFANECFITPVESVSFAPSYVAPVAFLDTLFAAIASLKRTRILGHLKQAEEEQRKGYRWYQAEF
ncbi:MAG: MurR/RpiR family transcriptional regulator [Acidobacteriaceae bacterium]